MTRRSGPNRFGTAIALALALALLPTAWSGVGSMPLQAVGLPSDNGASERDVRLWWDSLTRLQKALLSSMELRKALPLEPPNPLAHDQQTIALGESLFKDADLSRDGTLSCATCHDPQTGRPTRRESRAFASPGALDVPSLVAAPFARFLGHTGRNDSLYAQALTAFYDPHEHGLTPIRLRDKLRAKDDTRRRVDRVIDTWRELPNSGKRKRSLREDEVAGIALEAFLWTLRPKPTRLDAFVAATDAGDFQAGAHVFASDEFEGLGIFLGKGRCVACHHGPLLTDFEFHNVGSPLAFPDEDQSGRFRGAKEVKKSRLNCLSRPRTGPARCDHLTALPTERVDQIGAFRTPSLRDAAGTAPYFHAGQLMDLTAVVRHYSDALPLAMGQAETSPLGLSSREEASLVRFLATLEPTLSPMGAESDQSDAHNQ